MPAYRGRDIRQVNFQIIDSYGRVYIRYSIREYVQLNLIQFNQLLYNETVLPNVDVEQVMQIPKHGDECRWPRSR